MYGSTRAPLTYPYLSQKLPKILAVLQDLSIEGEGIDRLLRTAADIRERRLGRNKRASVSVTTPTRTGTVFGRRLWSASPADKSTAAAADFELDDRSSAAGSDASRPSRLGQRFGSLAFSSPRSSATADLADNVTVVEGKVLPPPPARVDQHERPPDTIASLIEEELRAETEYGVDDDSGAEGADADGAAEATSLRDRATSGWGGLKSSLSRLAASDTAAALQKRATNLQLAAAASASTASARLSSSDAAAALYKAQSNAAAKATLLAQQLAQDTPERIARLRDAGGRLVASTGAERGGERRPGSPRETPFTPPGGGVGLRDRDRDRDVSPLSSPRMGASASVDMARGGSNGPKPLLLSSAARRAKSESEDGGSVVFARSRSPSQSPVLSRAGAGGRLLSPDMSIPPLSRSPSSHGRSLSHFDSPSRGSPSAASAFRPRSPSLQQTGAPLQDDDSPIVSRRVQDGAAGLRRGGPSMRAHDEHGSHAARPAQGGRGGWSLSDAPVRLGAQETQTPAQLPTLELGFDPSTMTESVEPSSAASQLARVTLRDAPARAEEAPRDEPFLPLREEPFLPPSEAPFVPPSGSPQDEPFSPARLSTDATSPRPAPPPRGSSLALSASHSPTAPAAAPLAAPPRKSSLNSSAAATPTSPTPAEDGPDAESAAAAAPAKLSRRPAAQRKRTSRMSQASISGSVDLSGPEARRVASEFLTRSTSGTGIGAGQRRPGHSRRTSEALSQGQGQGQGAGAGSRASVATFDEGALFASYGDEEGER